MGKLIVGAFIFGTGLAVGCWLGTPVVGPPGPRGPEGMPGPAGMTGKAGKNAPVKN